LLPMLSMMDILPRPKPLILEVRQSGSLPTQEWAAWGAVGRW
jgi:hypothetical protein